MYKYKCMDHTYKSVTLSDYNIISNTLITNNTIITNNTEYNYRDNLAHNEDPLIINDYTNTIIQAFFNTLLYYLYRFYQYLMVIIIELLLALFLWYIIYWLVLRKFICIREMFETI